MYNIVWFYPWKEYLAIENHQTKYRSERSDKPPPWQDLRHHDKEEDDGGHDKVDHDDPAQEEEVGGDDGAKLGLDALDLALPGDQVGRVFHQPPEQ